MADDLKKVREFHERVEGNENLREPDTCRECDVPWPCLTERLAVEVERQRTDRRAYAERCWDAGFHHALYWYGIWKDGVQTIGCQETPIKDATPQEGQRDHDLSTLDVDEPEASMDNGEEHVDPIERLIGGTELKHSRVHSTNDCAFCDVSWPCDTVQLARLLKTEIEQRQKAGAYLLRDARLNIARGALAKIKACVIPFRMDPLEFARDAVAYCQTIAKATLEEIGCVDLADPTCEPDDEGDCGG